MKPLRIISRNSFLFAGSFIALALVLLLILAALGFAKDFSGLRKGLLLEVIQSMRSRALHTVGRIEQQLESGGEVSLNDLKLRPLATGFLTPIEGKEERYPYAAIVNSAGVLVWHSTPSHENQQLDREWYEKVVYELGTDVVRTKSPELTAGTAAYDVNVPILLNGKNVGSYHIGLSQDWFDSWSAEARREFLLRRSLALGAVLMVVAAAAVSLYSLSRRVLHLQNTVTVTYMQAASELGRLAAGLAHEIRNPLHALRLNLHAFRRTQQDPGVLEPAEIDRMLEQSTGEIDRIDKLLRQLIDFAMPNEPQTDASNLNSELEGVTDFIQQELRRSDVCVQLELPKYPVSVRMDPARLRQVMLNLLHNSRDSMPEGGTIEVQLTRKDAHVEISVADQGAGIAEADLPHVFEPFFTTRNNGTGLGLALVKRFVQEAGGEIRCEANVPHGTRFRIRLCEAASAKQRGRA